MSDKLLARLRPILFLLVGLWIIEVVNWLTGHALNPVLGLKPCETAGLVGIPFMPLLHGSFAHLIANSVPLAVLGSLGVLVTGPRFLTATILIVVFSGLAVWLFARCGVVVGASGLIFGWFGFLVAAGVIERSARALVGAAIAFVLYGGLIWGVIPQRTDVSWEAHLFGALAGGLTAWMMLRRR